VIAITHDAAASTQLSAHCQRRKNASSDTCPAHNASEQNVPVVSLGGSLRQPKHSSFSPISPRTTTRWRPYAGGRQHACKQRHKHGLTVQCTYGPISSPSDHNHSWHFGGLGRGHGPERCGLRNPAPSPRRQRYCMHATECRTCRHHQRGT
jgi:hypothetical protein